MSDLSSPIDRLLNLTGAVCNGTVSEDDVIELDAILRADRTSLVCYLDYCQMHASLKLQLRASRAARKIRQRVAVRSKSAFPHLGESDCVKVETRPAMLSVTPSSFQDYLSSGWPLAYLAATVITGLGMVIGTLLHVSSPVHVANQSSFISEHSGTLSEKPKPSIVGRITGLVDCKWGNAEMALTQNANVSLRQKYALRSGLMEITYDTGAKVILQGPVTYEVESQNGGFLSVGKLTARVENEVAKGFTVRTSIATVTDLGTEFGIDVSAQGDTTAHVFRGAVKLETAADKGKTETTVCILHADESAQVERTDDGAKLKVRPIAVDPNVFVRVEQFPNRAEDVRPKPFRRWQTYSNTLRRDPSLVAYYDFQLEKDKPRVLRNVAHNADRSLDGVIVGAAWCDGRMAGKQALQFNGPDDRVRVNLPQTVNDLTLVAWLRLESFDAHPGIRNILSTDGWGFDKPGAVSWLLLFDGRPQFAFITGASDRWYEFVSWEVFQGRGDRWTQLATVYDSDAARVTVYVDGRLVNYAEEKYARPVVARVPLRIGTASIGRWENSSEGIRTLLGRIDELAIFGRALKMDELRKMFEAGESAETRAPSAALPKNPGGDAKPTVESGR